MKHRQYCKKDFITGVSCFDYTESYSPLKYKKEEKNIFGKIKRKKGFYNFNWIDDGYIGDKLPENHIIKDNVVFEFTKPRVVIFFKNETTEVKYFDSYDEAQLFLDKIVEGGDYQEI